MCLLCFRVLTLIISNLGLSFSNESVTLHVHESVKVSKSSSVAVTHI